MEGQHGLWVIRAVSKPPTITDRVDSLRLATHLLAESLLDKDHYLDWLLNAINQSDLDKLSVYLLIANSHLEELGQSRRYGRRLLESVLEQLHKVCCSVTVRFSKPDLHARLRVTPRQTCTTL